jgi:hypothetical protein
MHDLLSHSYYIFPGYFRMLIPELPGNPGCGLPYNLEKIGQGQPEVFIISKSFRVL